MKHRLRKECIFNMFENELSDQRLCEILGSKTADYDTIDQKIEEAYAMIRRSNKRNYLRKVLIGLGSAAAVFLLVFAVGVMNPVMASGIPILGDIFTKVADVFRFGKIPQEQSETLYVPEQKEIKAGQPGQDGGQYQVCDGDITVTVEEEYISNQALFLGLRIENAQEFPEMAAYVDNGGQWLQVRTKEAYSFRPEPLSTRRTIEGKFEDVHTFIGIMRIDYSEIAVDDSKYSQAVDEADEKGEEYPELNNLTREEWMDYYAIPKAFDMRLEITQIIGTLKNPSRPEGMKSDEELAQMTDEELGEYRNSLPREWVGFPNAYQHWYQDGSWRFELPIRQTDEAARIISVNEVNEEGLGVESIELSSVEMTVNTIEKTLEPLWTVVFDAEGSEIAYGGDNSVYVIAGHDISRVTVCICRFDDYGEAKMKAGNALNGKSFRELIADCALFETTVDTRE